MTGSKAGISGSDTNARINDLPAHWDWNAQGKVTPPKNVGQCGSCWAFAAVGAVESKILITADVEKDLAEQQLMSCSDAGSCDGGNPEKALQYIRDEGLVDEICFPYQAVNDVPCQLCDQVSRAKIEGYYKVSLPSDFNSKIIAIKEAIYIDGPVVIYQNVYQDFYSYSSGIYTHTGTDGIAGMNSMILVGWDDTEQYWIARNNWGIGWGEDGFVRIAWDAEIGIYDIPPLAVMRTDYNGNGIWDGEENQAPVAVCQDISVSADQSGMANVMPEQVDAGSYDPDGDPITLSLSPAGPYPVGQTEVLLIASDGQNTGSCIAVITVTPGTQPPLVTISEPIELWPPNHKYETIDVTQLVVAGGKDGIVYNTDDVFIASVSCDEAEEATSDGEGCTYYDILIAGDCRSVQLRKERQGGGNGRVYTIALTSHNGNPDEEPALCYVTIPHDQGRKPVVDDGAAYTVEGSCAETTGLADLAHASQRPDNYLLKQNFPNPFNPATIIRYELPETGYVKLTIYSILGKEIAVLADGMATAGSHQVAFNAGNLPSGIYLCRLQAGSHVQVKKMLLTK